MLSASSERVLELQIMIVIENLWSAFYRIRCLARSFLCCTFSGHTDADVLICGMCCPFFFFVCFKNCLTLSLMRHRFLGVTYGEWILFYLFEACVFFDIVHTSCVWGPLPQKLNSLITLKGQCYTGCQVKNICTIFPVFGNGILWIYWVKSKTVIR